MLLTPEVFRRYPHARLYGWSLPEYQRDPAALARDLPHRRPEGVDWPALWKRLGWLTFEDCERITPASCRWLTDAVPEASGVPEVDLPEGGTEGG